MNQRNDLDRMLSAWLDDPFTPPAPAYLGEVLERTRRTRQRPAWASLERWLPMELTMRTSVVPRWGWLVTVLALLYWPTWRTPPSSQRGRPMAPGSLTG